MPKHLVTRECVEHLHSWVHAHCPCAVEEPNDLLRGLISIVDEAVREALQKERNRFHDILRTPSQQ
jgi:hypothetical protein